jgi:methylglyoxal synthase
MGKNKSDVRILKAKKRIALVAHDNKKKDLQEWAQYNKSTLKNLQLFATGTTAKILSENVGLEIKQLLSGPLGGDQQIGAMIAENKIDVVVFFWDPMSAQPHDTDVKALIRLCAVWNVPVACNRSTADFMISSPLMGEEYEVQIPDYKKYIQRKV